MTSRGKWLIPLELYGLHSIAASPSYTAYFYHIHQCHCGIWSSFISDNGSQYASEGFAHFEANCVFYHTTSHPHYHQPNGKAKGFEDVMKQMLAKALKSQQDINMAMFCVWTTHHGLNLPSLAELLSCHVWISQSMHIPWYDSRSCSLHELSTRQSVRVQDSITGERFYFQQEEIAKNSDVSDATAHPIVPDDEFNAASSPTAPEPPLIAETKPTISPMPPQMASLALLILFSFSRRFIQKAARDSLLYIWTL